MNRKIKSHNAAAFPAQALSHVAQQIDALYWAAAEPDAEGAEVHPDAVRVGADLRDEEYVNFCLSCLIFHFLNYSCDYTVDGRENGVFPCGYFLMRINGYIR